MIGSSVPSKHSVLVLICILSTVSCIVSGRKDEKAKQSDPQYRYNYEVDEQEQEDNTQFSGSDSDNTWNMKGTYGFRKPSGEYRVVDYLANEYGFTANVKTNEPGSTSSSSSESSNQDNGNSKEKGSSHSSPSSGSNLKMNQLKMMMQNLRNQQQVEDEMVEQKPERLVREEEPTTVTTTSTQSTPPSSSSIPPIVAKMMTSNREVERERESPSTISEQSSSSPSKSSTTTESKPIKENQSKSLAQKLSIHQLIAEAMPSIQMSVVPVYFYNKASKKLVAVPYLIMNSVSKMPLLPGMLEQGLSSSLTPPSMGANSINLIHSPLNQRLRSRSLSHLGPLVDHDSTGFAKHNLIENESSNAGPVWMSVNGNGHQLSPSLWK